MVFPLLISIIVFAVFVCICVLTVFTPGHPRGIQKSIPSHKPIVKKKPFSFESLEWDGGRNGWVCTATDGSVYFSKYFIKWRYVPSFDEASFSACNELENIIKRDLLRNGLPTDSYLLSKERKIILKGWDELKMESALG